jgi:hypothetical protein
MPCTRMVWVSIKVKKPEILVGQFCVEIVTPSQSLHTTLKKERKPLQYIIIFIVLYLLVSYKHLTTYLFDVYFCQT